MSTRHFVFIEGSSRTDGNTAALARRAQQNLPAGATSEWINLADFPLPDFQDSRSPEDPPPIFPDGNEGALLAATLRATDLVIVSPLYWYSVSAPIKRYLDFWSSWLKIPGLKFRRTMTGRAFWAITVGSDTDQAKADGLVASLRLSAEYMNMNWAGLLYGSGDYPGDIEKDLETVKCAEYFLTLSPNFATEPDPIPAA